ncbi:MAG: zinc ABC transporter substrate-binding protein, partial [Pseudomonadota bacterium]
MSQDFALSRRAVLAGLTALAGTPIWAQGKLNIVATTGMIADLVRQIGGDTVAVQGLMGAGVDPHAYRQTRSDIVATAPRPRGSWRR